ncbi:MAG: PEP-CTERM/exosortase system-associated acyltransferase [Acidobacteriota bacterium]
MNLIDRNHAAAAVPLPGPRFLGRPLDNAPRLLEDSYRLRYQVYCLEQKFLPVEDYPAGLEFDAFDCHSLHVGAVDASGELAGTSRAVRVSHLGLPLFDHCTSFPHETEFHRGNPRLVEVGRLVIAAGYRRHRDQVACDAETVSRSVRVADYQRAKHRRVGDDVFMTVLKALYEETQRVGATHWLTAMEEPLRRQLDQQGFPFRAFGPECEYYGRVIPYQMALNELDRAIVSGRFPGLKGFSADLDHQLAVGPHALATVNGRLPAAMMRSWDRR